MPIRSAEFRYTGGFAPALVVYTSTLGNCSMRCPTSYIHVVVGNCSMRCPTSYIHVVVGNRSRRCPTCI